MDVGLRTSCQALEKLQEAGIAEIDQGRPRRGP